MFELLVACGVGSASHCIVQLKKPNLASDSSTTPSPLPAGNGRKFGERDKLLSLTCVVLPAGPLHRAVAFSAQEVLPAKP